MPFCTQCGSQVTASAVFCASCGERQQTGGASRKASDFLAGIPPRTASMLCYIPVVGWIPAVVVLAAERFREERSCRFHAFQGLYLFVAWLILDWGVMPFFFWHDRSFMPFGLGGMLKAIIFAAWILMLIKTSKNEDYRLPIFGDLAEKSVAEQR
ncbi:MAG: zinc-ribbon domain-containing protein [Acidobacteriia bacterium]|nr:zinc-ribbon domain-containing protein [Terriglobia bacterium]